MRRPVRALAVIASVSTLVGGVCLWRAVILEQRIQDTARDLVPEEDEDVQTYTTEWTSGGVGQKVETVRNTGETVAAWAQRHADAVAALQKIYPPDGTPK